MEDITSDGLSRSELIQEIVIIMAVDLACSGSFSEAIEDVFVDGRPLLEVVEEIEKDTGRDLTKEAHQYYQ